MDSVAIKPLTPTDYSDVGKIIIAASMPYWQEQGLSENTIQEISKQYNAGGIEKKVKGNPFYVAEEVNINKIVGIIGLSESKEGGDRNQLSTFFIDPEYQGKGLGRSLYEKVKAEAIKNNYTKLVVSSSPNAEIIYEHLGFKKVRVDWKEYENGSKHYEVWMEQSI